MGYIITTSCQIVLLKKEHLVMMVMMIMMNCFCGMVDCQKEYSWDHCQKFSPLRISSTLLAGFEPAQNMSLGFVESSCAVVITIIPQCHYVLSGNSNSQHSSKPPPLPSASFTKEEGSTSSNLAVRVGMDYFS